MSDFAKLQKSLGTARTGLAEAALDFARAGERFDEVERELSALARREPAPARQPGPERQAVERKRNALDEKRREAEARLGEAKRRLQGAADVFANASGDPRENAGEMDDALPVMLFPLRIETRFRSVISDTGAPRPQLWVRIYPDECLVDGFEPTLTKAELKGARIFWREYFHAAGDEAAERAAWRALVSGHGAGRATWIFRNYRPLNPLRPGDPDGDPALEPKPQAAAAGEVLLVAVVEEGFLSTAERAAIGLYWPAVWRSAGDSPADLAALAALRAATGADRAAALAEASKPYNLGEAPAAGSTRASSSPRLVVVTVPAGGSTDTKARAWNRAATVSLLPDRFVLLGYQGDEEVLSRVGLPVDGPFQVSPDPKGNAEEQFKFDDEGNLTLGEGLRWMVDFDEAVRRGMGFRVDLSPEQERGFDRLLVLGLRLSAGPTQAADEVQALFQNHFHSRSGFALLPQGAATNNTDEGPSGYARGDDADASFDFVFKAKAQFDESQDPLEKSDGQWFAELLGLDPEWLKQVPQAGGRDQAEARAMNVALWPATLGYFMDTLMQPVFSDDDVYYTRWFFNRFVTGRGPLPAIRIGRQPYGILAASALRRSGWTAEPPRGFLDFGLRFQERRGSGFRRWLAEFKTVLDALHNVWEQQSKNVPHVDSQGGDLHQSLLDIVGLHPASVEFHQRYAQTREQEHNIALLWHILIRWQTLPANELHNEAFDLLSRLGYSGLVPPKLLDLFWQVGVNRLNGPVVQEGPLSEEEALRAVTGDGRNYIGWLRRWAMESFETVRQQDGFTDGRTPNALLYVLLRHALELGYYDAGIRVLDDAGLLSEPVRLSAREEPFFFHVAQADGQSQSAGPLAAPSRYALLYSAAEDLTGDSRLRVVDHVTRNIEQLVGTRYLAEQIRALAALDQTPTAALERLLAEHLDCGTYRLDAWATGLIGFQLASMRYSGGESGAATPGVHVGAYGWLEQVRPSGRKLEPVRLPEPLDSVFNKRQPAGATAPLVREKGNGGYIHAPSVNHAVTAAVLRNGYVSNATPANPALLKVNLSSERVRTALGFIEGIRNGQSLAALLGYQFERGLHDSSGFAECDRFIYPLRLIFPLYTQDQGALPEGATIESVEARNVVHGLNLLRHVRNASATDKGYPFGFPPDKLPPADGVQRAAIDREIDRLLDIHDALADLAIAEGVHQVVLGNYDRAGATLDAYGQAAFPPIPDVVQTPRSGIALTHRLALHFDPAAAPAPGAGPRATAESAIAAWVATVLPAPAELGCTVFFREAATGAARSAVVTQADIGLDPLDLVYAMNPDNLAARSELDDRVRDFVLRSSGLGIRPDLLESVDFARSADGKISFFQAAPLVRSLRALLLRSRPLRASDVLLPTEAHGAAAPPSSVERARIAFLPAALEQVRDSRLAPLKAAILAAGQDKAAILAGIDQWLDDFSAAAVELGRYGLDQTGIGTLIEQRAGIFSMLAGKAAVIALRWLERESRFDALIAEQTGLADEAERIALLLEAERLVSTAATDPEGMSAAAVETAVQAKGSAFKNRRSDFADFRLNPQTSIAGLVGAFQALLPLSPFEQEPTTTADEEQRLTTLAADIVARTSQLIDDLTKRAAAVTQTLGEHDLASSPDQRVEILTRAARSVFGEEFVLAPAFQPTARQAAEWANSYQNRAQLLDHQRSELGNDFPVDDWLAGVARVREKAHHLENLVLLGEALGTAAPELKPIQFPHRADASWMALEFPSEARAALESELLLYTAHYAREFDGADAQCGLLIDEWTEVIPAETETTGLAFHFDGPNAEPPQTILLATPPQFRGGWRWDDLVATLHETLERARLRAVGPAELDKTALSVFLPATVLATSWSPITIAADLSVVNNFQTRAP